MSKKPAEKVEAGNGTSLAKKRLEAIRSALQEKRADLVRQRENQLSELYNPDKHHLADLEEMASDTTDTDSLCAFVDLSSSTVEQIDLALTKIEEGTYGLCQVCEEPIHPDRLEVLPFASLCVKCQRKKELAGTVKDRGEPAAE
ncbi:MAG: TraR/DksA C4-type zinc finger protein [Planctomycetes bacterium]|nr:TraR/DksA C4-type zinc finger protein [Planctomycetota bacterium]